MEVDRNIAMTKPEQLNAPFTEDQVYRLNQYQDDEWFHPFTCCGPDGCRDRLGTEGNDRKLIATVDGWICPTCDYTQDWAWAGMVDYYD